MQSNTFANLVPTKSGDGVLVDVCMCVIARGAGKLITFARVTAVIVRLTQV